MRVLEIKRKVFIRVLTSIFLMSMIGAIASRLSYYIENSKSKIEKLELEASQIKNEIFDLQGKALDAKKFKEYWKKLSERKKNSNGIKVDDINANLSLMSSRYSISNTNINISLPEVLKDGPFKRETVKILFTKVSLTFNSTNDLNAIMFANDFLNSLPGYPILTILDISKNKDYTTQDLIDISAGKGNGLIVGRLEFVWYVYKS